MLNEKTLETDLCVVGGGLAGVCTAIAAARHGARVVLIQERPVLGGNASSEIRMWVCGAHGKNNRETGILEEIMLESLYRNPTKNFYIWDSILLDFVLKEDNITLLLNATCMDAETETGTFPHGRTVRIRSVRAYQMTTETFYTVSARYFADCSGDSVLAPLSGAEFSVGREDAAEYGEDTHVVVADRKTMGSSCLIQGRETTRPVSFIPGDRVTHLRDEDVANRPMDIYNSSENFWYLELGGDRDTIADAEEIKNELIPLALGTWDRIKNSGDYRAENWDLEFLGFLPGKRESRRMRGEYVVSQRDITDGKTFPDVVAFGGWPIDDHYPGGYYHHGTPNTDIHTPAPYPLPYRALYSRNVANLFFAGRNISMTHMAMSSMRVMATCALLGQAAGTAAAIAARENCAPHDVYLSHLAELQATLMADDCFLPALRRPVSDLCKRAALSAGGDELRNGIDRPNRVYGTETCGVTVPNGTALEYRLEKPAAPGHVHLVFDSDLDRETLPGDHCERTHATRSNVLLASPDTCLPKTLARDFTLEAKTEDGNVVLLSVRDNRRRAYHVAVPEKITALSLVVSRNWGETDGTRVFSFDF